MEEAIREVLKTKGWQYILQLLEKEMENNLGSIPTTQGPEAIASQFVGRVEAQQIIRKFLRKLETIGHEAEVKATKYK